MKIGAGARPTAMGEAFVGIADDVNAVSFNPAGLAYTSRPELTAMHAQWFQGMSYDFGAFSYPTNFGAFAISAASLKTDEIEKRATDESLQGKFDAMDAAYGLSYAKNIGPLLSLGITGRFLKQEIDTTQATTLSGDIGILKRMGRLPLTIGFSAKYLGENIEFSKESDSQPTTYDIGLGSNLLKEKLILGLDLKKPKDDSFQFGGGVEFNKSIASDFEFGLRGGYNSSITDANNANGISLGAGLAFRRLGFDFAWVPFGDLGNTFRYSAHMKF